MTKISHANKKNVYCPLLFIGSLISYLAPPNINRLPALEAKCQFLTSRSSSTMTAAWIVSLLLVEALLTIQPAHAFQSSFIQQGSARSWKLPSIQATLREESHTPSNVLATTPPPPSVSSPASPNEKRLTTFLESPPPAFTLPI